MLAPQTIVHNRYEIVRPIGHGGMGAVYEALDRRLNTRVALKQMTVQGAALSRAFEREAQLLAVLRHPALPRVIDHFSEPTGQYLVMDYIQGQDLSALLRQRRQPFPVATVLSWADQILQALEYLHSQQPPILHRDIKPQNLKLTPEGQMVLLDFGLAKGQTGQLQGATTSSVLGYTPHYASLEQIQGKRSSVQSDLYSLAATLYHLLTNTVPSDALERASTLLQGQPDPLLPAHTLVRQVPPSLSAALTQALAINLAQRPASAAAMRAALQPRATTPLLDSTVVARSGGSSAGDQTIPISPPGDGDAAGRLDAGPRPDVAGTGRQPARAAPRRLWLGLVGALIVWLVIVQPRLRSDDASAGRLAGGPTVSVPPSPTSEEQPFTPTPPTPSAAPGDGATGAAGERILQGHTAGVTSVAWSPDSQTLASGSADASVRVWNVQTAEQRLSLDTSDDTVALAFSADGSTLQHASSSLDIRRWNPHTGAFAPDTNKWTLPGEQQQGLGQQWAVAWSADGELLAAETGSGVVTLFHIADLQQHGSISHAGDATALSFSNNGQLVAIGTQQGEVQLWSISEQSFLPDINDRIFFPERAPITSLAFSPDDGLLASGSLDNRVDLASLADGPFLITEHHGLGVFSLAWSPNGALLASGGGDGTIYISQASSADFSERLQGHEGSVYGLAWSPDGRTLASAGADMTVRLWPRKP